MARWVFDVTGLDPLRRYRIDTASGSASPAVLTRPGNDLPIADSVLQADMAGRLPRFVGTAQTLYAKVADYMGAFGGTPVTITTGWDIDAPLATPSSGILPSTVAKGDLLAATAASTIGALPASPTTGMALVTDPSAPTGLAYVHPTPMIPNTVAMLGDSITAGNTTATSATVEAVGDKDPLGWVHLLTGGQARYAKNAGISGNVTAQMLARVTDVTGLSPRPSWCIVMGGTNDCSGGVTVAQYAANIKAIVAALTAARVRPLLVTPPPKTGGSITAGQKQILRGYVMWLRRYAAETGIPLADGWSALIDQTSTTGAMVSSYDSGDGIHPSAAGAYALGSAIAAVLQPLLVPTTTPIPSDDATAANGGINLLLNPLFRTDSNSDGVPDNWTKTGSGTVALVSGASEVPGQYLRLTDTVNQFTQVTQTVSTGFSAGDRIAFCGAVKSATTNGQGGVICTTAGSTTNWRPINGFTITTNGVRRFYREYVVPAGTTSIGASIYVQSGTGMDISVGQLGLYDLSQLGALS